MKPVYKNKMYFSDFCSHKFLPGDPSNTQNSSRSFFSFLAPVYGGDLYHLEEVSHTADMGERHCREEAG